jgi:ribosomal protein L40E
MPSLAPLQCLFCNHLNPAGASFCNDCGSQLHLQPCDHCGAINKRTAKHCYKCSAGFTLPPAPAPVPAAPASAPDLTSAPALRDLQPDYPVLNDFARATAPAPESATPQTAGTVSSPRWVTALKSRRSLRFAAAALLLAALVMSGDYYSEQSAEFTKTQGVIPFGPSVPDTAAVPEVAAPPAIAAPPAAGPVVTVLPPLAGEPDVPPRPDPPLFNECPDAVAALGLCSSGSSNEGK